MSCEERNTALQLKDDDKEFLWERLEMQGAVGDGPEGGLWVRRGQGAESDAKTLCAAGKVQGWGFLNCYQKLSRFFMRKQNHVQFLHFCRFKWEDDNIHFLGNFFIRLLPFLFFFSFYFYPYFLDKKQFEHMIQISFLSCCPFALEIDMHQCSTL